MRNEYTVAALVAPAAVLALELVVLRTGLLRRRRFWGALAIVLAFQIPVDGWLTAGRTPVVSYSATAITGVRWPWRIPIEDYGFGLALAALTMLLWERAGRRAPAAERSDGRAPAAERSDGRVAAVRRSGEWSGGGAAVGRRTGERHG